MGNSWKQNQACCVFRLWPRSPAVFWEEVVAKGASASNFFHTYIKCGTGSIEWPCLTTKTTANKQTQTHSQVWLMCAGNMRHIVILPPGCTLYNPALDTYISIWICAIFTYGPNKNCSVHQACLIQSDFWFNKHDICLYLQLHKDSKSPKYKQDSVCLDRNTSAFCNVSSMMLSVTADVLTVTWGVCHVLCGTAKKLYHSAATKHLLVLFMHVSTVSWPRTIIPDDLLWDLELGQEFLNAPAGRCRPPPSIKNPGSANSKVKRKLEYK